MRMLHGSIVEQLIVQTQRRPNFGLDSANTARSPSQGQGGPILRTGRRETKLERPWNRKSSSLRAEMKRADDMAYATQSRATGASFFERAAELRGAFAQHLARRRVYHTTLRELAQLSDRELSDLGLHRAQLQNIAREAAFERA